MHVTEQTAERLTLIGGKPKNLALRPILIGGGIFTIPAIFATHSFVASIFFLLVIWVPLSLSYLAFIEKPARVVFDLKSGAIEKKGWSIPFNEVGLLFTSSARIDRLSQRYYALFIERYGAHTPEDREIQLTAYASTASEAAAAKKTILGYLKTHGVVFKKVVMVPYDVEYEEIDSDEIDESDEVPESDARSESAQRWADRWNDEAAESRKCIYCDKRRGDGIAVELSGRNEDRGISYERLAVPRCRHCTRVHDLHGRLIPGLLVFFTWIATIVFVLVYVQKLTAFPLILITPVAAFLLGRALTNPKWFGTKPVSAWKDHAEFTHAQREGWTLKQNSPWLLR